MLPPADPRQGRTRPLSRDHRRDGRRDRRDQRRIRANGRAHQVRDRRRPCWRRRHRLTSHLAGVANRHVQARCEAIVRLATRADELPYTVGALAASSRSTRRQRSPARARLVRGIVHQGFAKLATVRQLRRALPHFGFRRPDRPAPEDQDPPVPEESSVASGRDERSWWLNARLPEDQGAIINQALSAMKEDLYRQRVAEAGPGVKVPAVTWGEALAAMAETSLAAGEARFPARPVPRARPPRTQSSGHARLDDPHGHPAAHPPAPTGPVRLLLAGAHPPGPLPARRRPQDAPESTRRLRRAIEHRDGGCRVSGCGHRRGLEIHHIEHWEDGGSTDPGNLIALCAVHHRKHHQGLLGITGNPELQVAPRAPSCSPTPPATSSTRAVSPSRRFQTPPAARRSPARRGCGRGGPSRRARPQALRVSTRPADVGPRHRVLRNPAAEPASSPSPGGYRSPLGLGNRCFATFPAVGLAQRASVATPGPRPTRRGVCGLTGHDADKKSAAREPQPVHRTRCLPRAPPEKRCRPGSR